MKNPVAKNARKYNLAQTHKDRKKALKKGYEKHKSRYRKVTKLMVILRYRLF